MVFMINQKRCSRCARISVHVRPEYADISSVYTLSNRAFGKALKACPFSDAGPNEDVIGEKLYGHDCVHDPRLGYYKNLYIGYVAENDFRAKGTSGGVIT